MREFCAAQTESQDGRTQTESESVLSLGKLRKGKDSLIWVSTSFYFAAKVLSFIFVR